MNVPREDYPAVVVMPNFQAPAYLSGRDDENLQLSGPPTLFRLGGQPVEELGRRLSAEGLTTTFSYQPVGAFVRMLAKIAYGFAVVATGCDLYQFQSVYVIPSMFGGSEDIGRWVGGSGENDPPAVSDLHYIRLGLDDGVLTVYVRLFARYGAPDYCVVVGKLREKKSLVDIGLPQGAHWTY